MAARNIPFEMLSAHADGALSPEDAAMVGRAAATDPETAARLAVLLSLRAGVSGLVEQPAPSVSISQIKAALDHQRRRNARRLGAALAAVLVVAAGSALWFYDAPSPTTPQTVAQQQPASIAPLIAAYDAWSAPTTLLAGSDMGTLSTLLTAAGLDQDFTTNFALPDGAEVQHTGYLGHLGCRLSLFETKATGRGAGPVDCHHR